MTLQFVSGGFHLATGSSGKSGLLSKLVNIYKAIIDQQHRLT